jgi:hypothetical protein
MGEMLRWAPHLPDTLVGSIPDTSQMLENGLAYCGAAFSRRQAVQMGLVESVEDLTKDIELNLVRGVIAALYGRKFIRALGHPGKYYGWAIGLVILIGGAVGVWAMLRKHAQTTA